MNWTKEKPVFTEDCVLIAASKMKDFWDYVTYIIKKTNNGDGEYWGWFTGYGEEYGDIEDMHADLYLILPNHSENL